MSNLSNCCNAGVKVLNGDEGTSYNKCTKCENACDTYDIDPLAFDWPSDANE